VKVGLLGSFGSRLAQERNSVQKKKSPNKKSMPQLKNSECGREVLYHSQSNQKAQNIKWD